MRICLVGSHGTGKTTLLQALKEKLPDWEIQIESLTRKAVSDSSKLNLTTPEESEILIAKAYMESFLNAPKNFIASRHMIDVLAYSMYLKKKNDNISDETLSEIDDKVIEIIDKKIFDLVCYIPIEFEQKESGEYREGQIANPDYQKDVDTIIKFLLWGYDIPYITITGSVEDRAKQVLEMVNKEGV